MFVRSSYAILSLVQVTIDVDSPVASLGIYLAYAVVSVAQDSVNVDAVNRLVEKCIAAVRSGLSLEALKDHPHVRPFRDLYWRLGIDPTKQRPAHEALIRRVLRGEGLPRINPVVDIGNALSILHALPVGLYDTDKLDSGRLILRFAKQGEKVKPLGSPERVLSDNQIVLATDRGQILHIFPHRDSEHTAVTDSTRNVLIVVAGISPIPHEKVSTCINDIINNLATCMNTKILQEPTLTKTEKDF